MNSNMVLELHCSWSLSDLTSHHHNPITFTSSPTPHDNTNPNNFELHQYILVPTTTFDELHCYLLQEEDFLKRSKENALLSIVFVVGATNSKSSVNNTSTSQHGRPNNKNANSQLQHQYYQSHGHRGRFHGMGLDIMLTSMYAADSNTFSQLLHIELWNPSTHLFFLFPPWSITFKFSNM